MCLIGWGKKIRSHSALLDNPGLQCAIALAQQHVAFLQMGKPPKKRSVADKVRKAKTSTEIKNNPFEVKINRKKFEVLGRKVKHDVGLPGVSRSKAITKVRDHLLQLIFISLHKTLWIPVLKALLT